MTMILCDICGSNGAKYGYACRMTPSGEVPGWEVRLDLCEECWEKFDYDNLRNNIFKSFVNAVEAGRFKAEAGP